MCILYRILKIFLNFIKIVLNIKKLIFSITNKIIWVNKAKVNQIHLEVLQALVDQLSDMIYQAKILIKTKIQFQSIFVYNKILLKS